MTGHRHGPGGHTGMVAGPRNSRYLTGALALILAFMAVEVVVGIIASSLALISDAGHMLTDAAAIALALIAARLATRPAAGNLTLGWKRVEILSAQANGITLWLLAAWFVYEAIRRLIHPPEVAGGLVLATALVGILIKPSGVLADRPRRPHLPQRRRCVPAHPQRLVRLHRHRNRRPHHPAHRLGPRRRHRRPDRRRPHGESRLGTHPRSWRIFLEAAPRGINVAAIDADLHAVDAVQDVHDLHVWEVTSGFPALSAHILVIAATIATNASTPSPIYSSSATASITPRFKSTTEARPSCPPKTSPADCTGRRARRSRTIMIIDPGGVGRSMSTQHCTKLC